MTSSRTQRVSQVREWQSWSVTFMRTAYSGQLGALPRIGTQRTGSASRRPRSAPRKIEARAPSRGRIRNESGNDPPARRKQELRRPQIAAETQPVEMEQRRVHVDQAVGQIFSRLQSRDDAMWAFRYLTLAPRHRLVCLQMTLFLTASTTRAGAWIATALAGQHAHGPIGP